LQASLITQWRSMNCLGPKIWQTTITPRPTSSSDGWTTVAGQTVNAADNPKRNLVNAWIRDGAPMTAAFAPLAQNTFTALRAGDAGHPLQGYIEVTDAIESARDSGLWRAPGFTTDGVHPSSMGHIAMSTALADLTRFGYP
jgi:lysophospholipase L1-like esterase